MIEDTIENNININSEKLNYDKLDKAVKYSGVEKFLNDKPQKLKTIIQEKGKNFSKGQLQRIALARAIYRIQIFSFLMNLQVQWILTPRVKLFKTLKKLKKIR